MIQIYFDLVVNSFSKGFSVNDLFIYIFFCLVLGIYFVSEDFEYLICCFLEVFLQFFFL